MSYATLFLGRYPLLCFGASQGRPANRSNVTTFRWALFRWPARTLVLSPSSPRSRIMSRIILYNPHSQSQRRYVKIEQDEWTKHQSTLEKLWVLENRILDDVKNIMTDQHSFSASYATPVQFSSTSVTIVRHYTSY
jgi:hypothetical protein